MDSEILGELSRLAGEIEQLRTEIRAREADAADAAMDGGGGDGFGLPLMPIGGDGSGGTFQFEGDKITHCNFYAAHRIVELQDVPIGQGGADGTWYLNVNHNNLDNATVEKTAGQNDDNHTSIKLFTIANGAIKKDYRGMPFVPIYA